MCFKVLADLFQDEMSYGAILKHHDSWCVALELFNEMLRAELSPDVVLSRFLQNLKLWLLLHACHLGMFTGVVQGIFVILWLYKRDLKI